MAHVHVGSAPLGYKATESKEDFLCDNAKRISWFLKCNNVDDCKDGIGANGSDELDCGGTTCYGFEETFHCDSGQCILQAQFCNGRNDCEDGSDEKFSCSAKIPPPQVPNVNTSDTQSSGTVPIVLAISILVGIIVLLAIALLMYKFRSKIPEILHPRYYRPICSKRRPFQNETRGEVLPLLEISKLKLPQQEQSPSNNDIRLQDISPSSSSYKLIPQNFVSVLEKVGNHPFAVYCMVGVSRSGKSYLLNSFKQNLSRFQEEAGGPAELEKNYSHEKMFKWRKGTAPKTVGIDIWSEPFFKDLPDGRKIAILLMDSEGLFGDERKMEENNVIFALSSIFSSVLMANCRSKTLTDTLHHLYDFSRYARSIDNGGDASEVQLPQGGQSQDQGLSQGHGQGQGSQKLVIMVRDFVNHDQFSYGYHDHENRPENSRGNYYKTQFNIDNSNSKISHELQQELDGILRSYKSVGFTLFPDPGEKFRLDPLKEFPVPEFIRVRDETVELLLSPEHLVPKKLFEKEVTGKKFISFVNVIDNIFKSEISKFLHPEDFNDFLGEISYSKVHTVAHEFFVYNLECELEKLVCTDTVIKHEVLFNQICEKAVDNFTSYTLFRTEQTAKDCKKRLRDQCKITFENIMEEFRMNRILKRSLVVKGSSI